MSRNQFGFHLQGLLWKIQDRLLHQQPTTFCLNMPFSSTKIPQQKVPEKDEFHAKNHDALLVLYPATSLGTTGKTLESLPVVSPVLDHGRRVVDLQPEILLFQLEG